MPDDDSGERSSALLELAELNGVSTGYWSFFGDWVEVPASTLRAVLGAMGIAVGTESEVRASLAAAHEGPWRELLPPSLVVREGAGELLVHAPDGHEVTLTVALEDGARLELAVPEQQPETREVDGAVHRRLRVPLPGGLPLGEHRIRASARAHGGDAELRAAACPLLVVPHRLEPPPGRPANAGRAWGVMAQAYSVRSRESWGIGDFADLGALAAIAGAHGADFLLINPIHAADVVPPIEPSPYLPATRRYVAALYVRPERIPEVAALAPAERARLDEAHRRAAAGNDDPSLLDRDTAWRLKREALEIVFAAPRPAARQAALDAFLAREGSSLADFALWCALEEHYAGEERPAETRDIRSPIVRALRERLADRVAFHSWLQWVADEQLAAARSAAGASGMRIGIMHDLAVGVHPLGSDAWAQRESYAAGVSVGAPPDMYNQQGQNWHQPPWLPAALARNGYAPLRDMVRGLLRHAGALRIDHIIGFFRLWWIPDGADPGAGTYVRYDHEAMIGALVLEAHRAGAAIIGEDLGNVEPWVRDHLADRGVLGTSVLWFENGDGGPTPPEHYREAVLATVTTHDLPPTACYLAGEHVELRARLGLLAEPVEHARATAEHERGRMLAILRERGLIGDDAAEEQLVNALHVHLAASPSRLLGVSLADAVGERRAQNQPGTHREYPNWQVPLAGPDGRCVLLDDLAANHRFRSLAAAVDGCMRRD